MTKRCIYFLAEIFGFGHRATPESDCVAREHFGWYGFARCTTREMACHDRLVDGFGSLNCILTVMIPTFVFGS
ncbi:MAG: hypothetical protein RLZZ568_1054 [Cyanobacteriota bacterium]